jgi:hypothetical protein
MPTQSELTSMTPEERRDYGFARVRDIAFDAVSSLWERRQKEGMTQADIADALGSDPGWVSKNMRGPGNWTLRTFGGLVEALRGEAQITIRAAEDPSPIRSNWHAYADYPVVIGGIGVPAIQATAVPKTDSPPPNPAPKILRGPARAPETTAA